MLPGERRRLIAEMILKNRSASVSELSKSFGVTEETIRRDLKRLESEGSVRRTHGGAISVVHPDDLAVSSGYHPGYPHVMAVKEHIAPFGERAQSNVLLKRSIAIKAASMVLDGETVLLDSGSTVLELAKLLVNRQSLVVVTHSILVAMTFKDAHHVSVNVLGGHLRPREMVLVGPDTRASLERIRVDKAFMACAGFSADHGATVADVFEADVKRQMVQSAKQPVLLADHTKWDQPTIASYARLGDFSHIISDAGLDDDACKIIESEGVEVLRAAPIGAAH